MAPMSMLLAALLSAAPAPPAGFAILEPARVAAGQDQAVRSETIARARQALNRPPAPIPWLHTEGTLPGHGIRDISIAAKRDHPITLDLALAWTLTGERAFLEQAGRYLDAWARIYHPSFNPIDETGFDALMLAYDLVEQDLGPDTRERVDGLWRRLAAGYLQEMAGTPKNAHTNWQSHRVKIAAMAAYQTGDPTLIEGARDAYRKQIGVNLRADGSTFDFKERDALHYVTYNLDPLMMAALAAAVHGDDWFNWESPSGSSLPKSLTWLSDFALGKKVHVEFANSKIAFDRERASAGQDEYKPHSWAPGSATNSFTLAARLDPRFAAVRDHLIERHKRKPAAWLLLSAPSKEGQ